MEERMVQITARIPIRTYYGLVTIAKKLSKEGILRDFKGGASKMAKVILNATVDAFVETGKISEEDIKNEMKKAGVEIDFGEETEGTVEELPEEYPDELEIVRSDEVEEKYY